MSIKSIALLTSGGDAPGMNAAIRAVVRTAIHNGLKVWGIYRGYTGLIENEFVEMDLKSVGGIINRGGTILLTSRSQAFKTHEGREQAFRNLQKHKVDALIVIGGDGSLRGAAALEKEFGIPTLTLPGTIDNDMFGTDLTIGFFTAVETALDAIDKIRDTATSHERLFIIEVMGHLCGNIALYTSIAGGAEAVFLPEHKTTSLRELIEQLNKGRKRGKLSSIIVTAEGAIKAEDLKIFLQDNTDFNVRTVTLGHVQRGGVPNAFDRLAASIVGYEAINQLLKGVSGHLIGIRNNKAKAIPYELVLKNRKPIDENLLTLQKVLAI